jgi:hypothetical protein
MLADFMASSLQMFLLGCCQPSQLALWLPPQEVVFKQAWKMLHESKKKAASS